MDRETTSSKTLGEPMYIRAISAGMEVTSAIAIIGIEVRGSTCA